VLKLGDKLGRTRLSILIATLLVFALAAQADAAAGSIHLAGPRTNTFGTFFNYQVTGRAESAANHVVVWEQFYRRSGCASSYAAERARTGARRYSITVFVNEPVAPQSSYALTAHFYASHLGEHGVCAYLINLASGRTYAHAAAWWRNLSASAAPAPASSFWVPALRSTAIQIG